jgi:hypothetical protein
MRSEKRKKEFQIPTYKFRLTELTELTGEMKILIG